MKQTVVQCLPILFIDVNYKDIITVIRELLTTQSSAAVTYPWVYVGYDVSLQRGCSVEITL